MSRKSSSLLTKTQRRRMNDDFSDLEDEKKYRDQQRIRERIKSGILDFKLLREYPDTQFELAFDDLEKDELQEALVDTYIVCERIRTLNGISREEMLTSARQRAKDAAGTDDVASLDKIEIQTPAEIEAETQDLLKEQFQSSVWEKRSRTLLKLGAGTFLPLLLMTFLNEYYVGGILQSFSGVVIFLVFFSIVCLVSGVLISIWRTITNELVPHLSERL